MNKIIRIGMDTSKSFFQLHGVDAEEKVVLRRTLRRGQMLAFFEKLAPTEIGMEACGASHHWARTLSAMGHTVKLMPPQLVKPYVRRNKNDPRDAEGVCEAMSRPTMRFVPIKSQEQQADLMAMGQRDQLTARRTEIANRIRGWASELGITAPCGLAHIEGLLAEIAARGDIPETARWAFEECAEEYDYVCAALEKAEARLKAWHRANELARRLAQIPSVGPVGSALLTMKIPDPKLFLRGRDLAAWAGLTPRDHSTANKRRIGAITRAGDEPLRAVLVSGATSVLKVAKRRIAQGLPVGAWIASLLARKSFKEAAVALANKVIRIAWKLMVSGERFDPARASAMMASPPRPAKSHEAQAGAAAA